MSYRSTMRSSGPKSPSYFSRLTLFIALKYSWISMDTDAIYFDYLHMAIYFDYLHMNI